MFNMKKVKLLTEDDRNEILNLYSQKNIVLEQSTTQQNYTLQDIQNILNRPPFNSKLNADNKFGPLTAGAIVKALDMIKSGQAGVTPQTIASKDATTVQSATQTDKGLAQSTPTLQTGPPSPSTNTQQTTTAQQPAQATTQTTTQQPAQATTQQPAQATTQPTTQQPQATAQSTGKGDDSTAIE